MQRSGYDRSSRRAERVFAAIAFLAMIPALASCEIEPPIKPPAVSIRLDRTTVEMDVDSTIALNAVVTPESAGAAGVVWSCDNPSVIWATPPAFKAIGRGSATVRASLADDSSVFAECRFVVNGIGPESVTVTPATFYLAIGTWRRLAASVLPENAWDKSVAWSSDDTDVAIVDENGQVIGLSAGTATITATARDGGVSGSATVIVSETAWSVTYDSNGASSGSVPVDSSRYAEGQVFTVRANTGNLRKTGYVLAGWTVASDGSGEVLGAGSELTMGGANLVLTAKWIVGTAYSIGDTGPAGGLIFHDKGDYLGGWRFMEAAPKSTEWTYKSYGAAAAGMGASGEAIGDGLANTEAIVAWHAANGYADSADYAARLCADLVAGGFDDWFLPSLGELKAMREKLHLAGKGDFIVTQDGGYWSSSELAAWPVSAFVVWFANGSWNNSNKLSGWNGYPIGTRAARRF